MLNPALTENKCSVHQPRLTFIFADAALRIQISFIGNKQVLQDL